MWLIIAAKKQDNDKEEVKIEMPKQPQTTKEKTKNEKQPKKKNNQKSKKQGNITIFGFPIVFWICKEVNFWELTWTYSRNLNKFI